MGHIYTKKIICLSQVQLHWAPLFLLVRSGSPPGEKWQGHRRVPDRQTLVRRGLGGATCRNCGPVGACVSRAWHKEYAGCPSCGCQALSLLSRLPCCPPWLRSPSLKSCNASISWKLAPRSALAGEDFAQPSLLRGELQTRRQEAQPSFDVSHLTSQVTCHLSSPGRGGVGKQARLVTRGLGQEMEMAGPSPQEAWSSSLLAGPSHRFSAGKIITLVSLPAAGGPVGLPPAPLKKMTCTAAPPPGHV